MTWSSHKNDERNTRTPTGPVFYNSKNKLSVLFQCHGSIWPKVFPWCFANIVFMIVLTLLESNYNVNFIGESPLGHKFLGLIVSFLIVYRVSSALSRYLLYQNHLTTLLMQTRELVQKAIVFSRRNKNNDQAAKEWRSEIAYRCLLVTRTTAAIAEYPVSKIAAYEIPELSAQELEFCTPDHAFMRHAEIPYGKGLDSFRVPLKVAQLLRETICSQEERLTHPMIIHQEMSLLASVDQFLNGYYGIRSLMMTPVPFPLIQMAHTIGLLYVYTLPFVFLKHTNGNLFEDCFNIFMLTYGFVGLILVSEELDDPFGDDANDLDVTAYAGFAADDVVIMIHDADGVQWADALRYKMNENVSKPINETTGLLPTRSEGLTKNKSIHLSNRQSIPDWML
ncbi:MAG: putative membrane chloride channel (bestrophin family) [Bacillariaceae sp.]|jgi:predicted membrane chloride channel (bestrophin family)